MTGEMLSFGEPTVYQRSKCFFTYGRMAHLDPRQLPTQWASKGKPWSTILAHDFIRRVDLVLPQESWDLVREALQGVSPPPEFCRVAMSLPQILQGEFFTEFIKIGDIIMLSQGRRDIDNVFTLKDGQLTMFIDKEAYERAGLVGKTYGARGARGMKPRWVVEFDLRSPSMFRGKRGFDRLVYACETVFGEPRTWLFCNLSPKAPDPNPLDSFDPVKCSASPHIYDNFEVNQPALKPPSDLLAPSDANDVPESMAAIYEWLSLVRLHSPRVSSADAIDPFLSRYQTPGAADEWSTVKLCTVSWEGLLPTAFARQMLVDVVLKLPSSHWFSLAVSSFPTTFYGDAAESTFLRLPSSAKEYLLWAVRSHE